TGNVNIDVYDMLGKKVESWTLPANENSATENVSGLAKGMYIYMITNGNTILQRGKVMIQR
ncbi:MAG TPA: T9SS type A sorting domain-containing protein, partial [Bacteroidia bacterium]|nr:T9SS type A sorting domain-containing protein [Bacteroidia bacterium]